MSEKFINMLNTIGRSSMAPKGNTMLTLDSTGYTNIDFVNIEKFMDIKLVLFKLMQMIYILRFKQSQSGVSDPIQSAKEIVAQISNGNHRISHFL